MDFATVSVGQIDEPTRIIILGDGTTQVVGAPGKEDLFFAMGCESAGRHMNQGANFGFADSRTKYYNDSPTHQILQGPMVATTTSSSPTTSRALSNKKKGGLVVRPSPLSC